MSCCVVVCCVLQVYNFTASGSWQEDKGWVQQLDVGWRVDAVRDAAYAALAQVNNIGTDTLIDTLIAAMVFKSIVYFLRLASL